MPPLRRLDPSSTATEFFVNRETPLKIFEDAAFSIPAGSAILRVFYGVGGQGKSALSRKIFRLRQDDPSYKDHNFALIDLHGRRKDDPDLLMVWIRNAFADTGIMFPAFDIALALLWQSGRSDEPFPKLLNGFLAKSKSTFDLISPDLVSSGMELLTETIASVPGLGPSLRRLGNWTFDKGKQQYLHATRSHLEALQVGGELRPPHELSKLLPWVLAQELNFHLKGSPNTRYVLLIDEYESVFDGGGSGMQWQENHFDRRLRSFISETNGLLAVFFSRELLKWEHDPDWAEDLSGNQHRLDGLALDDAKFWLQQTEIDDPAVIDAILDGATIEVTEDIKKPVYPLLLDLLLEHWRNMASKGTVVLDAFRLGSPSFDARCKEMIERLMRDYDKPFQITLANLAFANQFDRATVAHVIEEQKTGLALGEIDRLTSEFSSLRNQRMAFQRCTERFETPYGLCRPTPSKRNQSTASWSISRSVLPRRAA